VTAVQPRPWSRCSFLADEAGDPREGNAPPADRWLLVEHPGPWAPLALANSGLGAAAVHALGAWEAAERGRVLLVRRPGRAVGDGGPRRWFRVDSRPGRESVRTGTATTPTEWIAALTAPGDDHPDPMYLVCTHGRHDTCCAVRGRPLATALAALEPDRVWECSHIGGCRFAPALVLMPHGLALGGVPPSAAAAVVEDYRAGRVDPQWVRGRSALAPAAQAAQHHARLATGETAVDALRVTSVAQTGDHHDWRVELADPACTVVLRERRVPVDRPLTCASAPRARMRVFDLVELVAHS
jgi:hypothetical protein